MKNLYLVLLCAGLLSACALDLPDPIADIIAGKRPAEITFNLYSVYSDNNGDKIVNNGETVGLQVYLKNTGTSAAYGVRATFSTTSEYVSDFMPYGGRVLVLFYGDISGGSSSSYTIQFKVSSSAPAEAQIPININITDASGNRWTETFNVTVESARIAYDKYRVSSDGNGDGIINNGETVGLQVYLKNIGTSMAKGVQATFSTTSEYVSDFTPTTQISYGDISAGSNSSYTIQFKVSSAAPANTQIPININITDESGNTWRETFNVTEGEATKAIAFEKYEVSSDNNRDKIVNNGETVSLQVYLKNTGTSAAYGVGAKFSTTSPYIYMPAAQVYYGDIAAGSSKSAGSNSMYFTVYSTVPGTQIFFSIDITDNSGNTWTEIFYVTIEATKASIAFDKYTIYSDNNGDGIVNKGETVQLQVHLKNTGTGTANGVKARFSTTSSYVSGLTPTTHVDYGSIAAGSSQKNYISFTVGSSAPEGTQIPISINITDENGNTWTSSFNVTVQ